MFVQAKVWVLKVMCWGDNEFEVYVHGTENDLKDNLSGHISSGYEQMQNFDPDFEIPECDCVFDWLDYYQHDQMDFPDAPQLEWHIETVKVWVQQEKAA